MKARGGGQAFAALAAGLDAGDHGQARQARLVLVAAIREEPIDLMADAVNSGPDPAMISVICLKLCPVPGWAGMVFRHPAHQGGALPRKPVIAAALQDQRGRIALEVPAALAVADTPLQAQGFQQRPRRRDPVTALRPAARSNDRRSVLPSIARTPKAIGAEVFQEGLEGSEIPAEDAPDPQQNPQNPRMSLPRRPRPPAQSPEGPKAHGAAHSPSGDRAFGEGS
jgi:hypothetical protein